jgi:ATP-dependent HslUV protease ATP-binding subunit HslU
MIPEELRHIVDEILDEILSEENGGGSTTASAGGEYNSKFFLKKPKNSLTKQYVAMLEAEGVTLTFSDESLRELASLAFQANLEVENIGARRLQTVMSHLLNDILFDVPEKIPSGSGIEITREMVSDKLSSLIKNKDLSQYIL